MFDNLFSGWNKVLLADSQVDAMSSLDITVYPFQQVHSLMCSVVCIAIDNTRSHLVLQCVVSLHDLHGETMATVKPLYST